MTGDLSLFSKFRDIQAADYVRRRAELGWFDVEFTMYGCAYLDIHDNKMRYKVSSREEDIYDFIEKSSRQDLYVSNLESFTQKYPVPSGMKQYIADEVKKELARNLQKKYSAEFFKELACFAEAITSNIAADYLWEAVERMEGTFDEKQLRFLESEIHYWYGSRKLFRSEYLALLYWLEEEKKNMDEIFVIKDIQKKTLYGFAYENAGTINYTANAQLGTTCRMSTNYAMRGYTVSPIWSETYWYNYSKSISQINQEFKYELQTVYSKEYFNNFRNIKNGTCIVTEKNKYSNKVADMESKYGANTAETLKRYGYRWGIL